MNCDEFQEQLSALIDNELADGEAEGLFRHMGECVECRSALRSHMELRSDLKEDFPPLAPKELDRWILSGPLGRREGKPDRGAIPGKFWQGRVSMRIPVATAATVMIILGSIFFSSMWFGSNHASDVRSAQTVYLTAVPTVEVRAYTMKPMTTIQ